jgi:hypothetical protein
LTREGRGARAALPFLLGLRLAPQPYETTVDACLSPARGLQPSLACFKTPGRVPRRDAPSAPPRSNALSTHITRGLFIRSFRLSSLSGEPARGFPVRSWSPLARDPRPSQLGPGVFPKLATFWHRGCQDYAGRTFCLENKLCTICVNEVEIGRVFLFPGYCCRFISAETFSACSNTRSTFSPASSLRSLSDQPR